MPAQPVHLAVLKAFLNLLSAWIPIITVFIKLVGVTRVHFRMPEIIITFLAGKAKLGMI